MPPTGPETGRVRSPTVLHLLGSSTSAFYHQLSLVYGREALLPPSMSHHYAVVLPGGDWRHGPSLDRLSSPVGLGRFVAELGSTDLVVPYMFDPIGMTSYRSLFEDVLGIPVVGTRAEVTSVATDKVLTKQIVGVAGVPGLWSRTTSRAGRYGLPWSTPGPSSTCRP